VKTTFESLLRKLRSKVALAVYKSLRKMKKPNTGTGNLSTGPMSPSTLRNLASQQNQVTSQPAPQQQSPQPQSSPQAASQPADQSQDQEETSPTE
jgi:hypothetical protein